jgi:hypothetical protein
MPTKPYSLQSPEQIAKDYAGNKQKIAQAAQSGLLDPTAAVMAGMFIDRMRSAQGQEQGPPSTVAQQVFAPPPPPMQMGAMSPGAPPMGAPRPPVAAPPPQGAPPVGMAGGGLTTLPLPDNMFNEPDGMGYAGGGIVAFAEGGPTPPSFYGLSTDPLANAAMYERVVGPLEGKDREAYREYLSRMRDPGALAAQKKQDLWSTLAQVGFGMAGSNSPYFLQAAGQAGSAALPGMMQATKDRKAQEREAIRGMADVESLGNRERQERGGQLFGMSGQARSGLEGQAERAQRAELQEKEIAARERLARMTGGGGGGGSGGSGGGAGFKDTPEAQAAAARYAEIMLRKDAAMAKDPKLRAAYLNNPQKYDAMYEATARRQAYEYAASLRQSGKPVDPQQGLADRLLRGNTPPGAGGGADMSNLSDAEIKAQLGL